MYIALRWLLGLTLAMWISMCCIDVLVTRNFEIKQEGYNHKTLQVHRNLTFAKRKLELLRDRYYKHTSDKLQRTAISPLLMFLAGALAVSMYNRKTEIVLYTKNYIIEVKSTFNDTARGPIFERFQKYTKKIVKWTCDCTALSSNISWVYIKNGINQLWSKLCALIMWKQSQKPRINIMLLKKLQEIGKERKSLGQLLVSAIHENKNIRMQYELENLAKNRLVRHIENTQKVIKENRTSYVNFQQLYLATHQENSFLKSRIKKLTKEKDEAEKNLLQIMNEVYKSKNNQLKVFCSRFIVKTDDNLLNTDAGSEIQKFLERARKPVATTSNWQLTDRPNLKVNSTNSCPLCANESLAEVISDDVLVPLVSEAPKLKGLPGEFVWTVKDKDGLISKLYEYDFTSDLDDGDTIRRIRQYSVYFDKDCLLDSISSKTVINSSSEAGPTAPQGDVRSDYFNYPITTQRFLTGSRAFKKFMKNNANVIASHSSTRSAIM